VREFDALYVIVVHYILLKIHITSCPIVRDCAVQCVSKLKIVVIQKCV
jgi:hypothetical protein